MTEMFNLLFATIVTMFEDAIMKAVWYKKRAN